MSKLLLILLTAACFGLIGCSSVKVVALDPSLNVEHICIEQNPAVVVGDFLGVIEDGLARHDMSVRVFYGARPDDCEYILQYTALQSWDFATYLSHAELRIYKDDKQTASAIYHLVGGGGFDMSKWQSTKTKMDPVIDELLSKK